MPAPPIPAAHKRLGGIVDGWHAAATTLLSSGAHGLSGGFEEGHRSDTVGMRCAVVGEGRTWQV